MSIIYLIDTTVFLNILDVPNRNDLKDELIDEYESLIRAGHKFIMPLATIIETGNHIAQNGDGGTRRKTAQLFIEMLNDAFAGKAPFRIHEFTTRIDMQQWLHEFPNHAMRNKSAQRTGEGTSFGDLSIIKDFELTCRRFSMTEIKIWSLDSDLMPYHHQPSTAQKDRF